MKKKGSPNVHDSLKGFDIKINALGEMETSFSVDKINDFLNVNLDDKKIISNKSEEE